MSDCNREGHDFTIARDGIGYCRRCDDWHDLESLRPAAPPPRFKGHRHDEGQRYDHAQLLPDAR